MLCFVATVSVPRDKESNGRSASDKIDGRKQPSRVSTFNECQSGTIYQGNQACTFCDEDPLDSRDQLNKSVSICVDRITKMFFPVKNGIQVRSCHGKAIERCVERRPIDQNGANMTR